MDYQNLKGSIKPDLTGSCGWGCFFSCVGGCAIAGCMESAAVGTALFSYIMATGFTGTVFYS